MNDLVTTDYEGLTTTYLENSTATNTIVSYRSDWKHFTKYCLDNSLVALPATPKTLMKYIVFISQNYKVSTINRHLSSISSVHSDANYDSPTTSFAVHKLLKGIKRTNGCKVEKKSPITADQLEKIVGQLGNSLIELRDKAIVLIGFAGAFRRSEIASLTMENLDFTSEGVAITLDHSKTDQENSGYTKGIPFGTAICPVTALKVWLEASGIKDGFIFRHIDRHGNLGRSLQGQSVALIIKKVVGFAGLDSSKYSGHSLRSGFITTASRNSVSERDIMRQSGHCSVEVMRGYIHDATIFNKSLI